MCRRRLSNSLENAYTASGGKNRAAGIVMDVNTGEILGMAVYPFFDLNDPWTLDEQSEEKLSDCECEPGTEEHDAYKQKLLMRNVEEQGADRFLHPRFDFQGDHGFHGAGGG